MADPYKNPKAPLRDIAEKIDPAFTWDNLVLPDTVRERLREIASHVRHRAPLCDDREFSGKKFAVRGIGALFVGKSGREKRMAAEVLANDLRLDLYRIDLASIINKFIGETEKNLDRIFDAAEASGPILFFDEAAALFGKRSEVKDSDGRFVNTELDYLLQQVEQYRGLAILATDHKSALDSAFLRRLRFVVEFPPAYSDPR